MQSDAVTIIKANGDREPFDEHKLRRSIRRAHIPQEYWDEVVEHVKESLHDGISTRDIYQHINDFFSHSNNPQATTTYNLKQAILELGPSGYPFERYVGALLKHHGYDVQVGTLLRGKCVTHEIDVLAYKGDDHFMIECKFHNDQGLRSDVKVALYVQARYEDVLEAWQAQEQQQGNGVHKTHKAWIFTNTRFSVDAIQYAQCVGIDLVGWSYPEKGSLQDLIEEAGLHPVTCLTSLSQSQKQYLLEKDIVIARNLKDMPEVVAELHLDEEKRQRLENELDVVLTSSIP